jgi:hypothetical protein
LKGAGASARIYDQHDGVEWTEMDIEGLQSAIRAKRGDSAMSALLSPRKPDILYKGRRVSMPRAELAAWWKGSTIRKPFDISGERALTNWKIATGTIGAGIREGV